MGGDSSTRQWGVQFEPSKSELIHFSKTHRSPTATVQLGNALVAPLEEVRFLGVWFDRRLRWHAHIKRVRIKLQTQGLALSKIARSAWGYHIKYCRTVYTAVIRAAIVYGAAVAFHSPAPAGGPLQGRAKDLAKA